MRSRRAGVRFPVDELGGLAVAVRIARVARRGGVGGGGAAGVSVPSVQVRFNVVYDQGGNDGIDRTVKAGSDRGKGNLSGFRTYADQIAAFARTFRITTPTRPGPGEGARRAMTGDGLEALRVLLDRCGARYEVTAEYPDIPIGRLVDTASLRHASMRADLAFSDGTTMRVAPPPAEPWAQPKYVRQLEAAIEELFGEPIPPAPPPGPPPMDLPADFGAVIGWREWRLDTSQSKPLRALSQTDAGWDLDWQRATCLSRRHAAPAEHCHCGFNAYSTFSALPRAMWGTMQLFGVIAAKGELEVHPNDPGFRAEWAKPLAFGLWPSVEPDVDQRNKVAEMASALLKMPLLEVSELEDYAKEFASPMPEFPPMQYPVRASYPTRQRQLGGAGFVAPDAPKPGGMVWSFQFGEPI